MIRILVIHRKFQCSYSMIALWLRGSNSDLGSGIVSKLVAMLIKQTHQLLQRYHHSVCKWIKIVRALGRTY